MPFQRRNDVKSTSLSKSGQTLKKYFFNFDQDFSFFDLCFDVELTSIRPTSSHWVSALAPREPPI